MEYAVHGPSRILRATTAEEDALAARVEIELTGDGLTASHDAFVAELTLTQLRAGRASAASRCVHTTRAQIESTTSRFT